MSMRASQRIGMPEINRMAWSVSVMAGGQSGMSLSAPDQANVQCDRAADIGENGRETDGGGEVVDVPGRP